MSSAVHPTAQRARQGTAASTVVLLLPRKLDVFIAADQARDLLEADSVHAIEPGRVPWGSLGRLPRPIARPLARVAAGRLELPADPRVFVIWHPWQYPLARALLDLHPHAELWFCVWDHFIEAFSKSYHDDPGKKARLARLYDETAGDASLIAAISTHITELEHAAGREAVLVPHGVDSMPEPRATTPIVAACLGYLTPRVDWRLLRQLAQRMDDLTILMIGPEDGCEGIADYQACRKLPNFVWLGQRRGHEVTTLIQCADVGLVPLRVEPYNHGSAPHRILKYARLGRWSITTNLNGVATFERAVIRARTPQEWETALREQAGARDRPDLDLRAWALGQSTRTLNGPLWERLEELELVDGPP
jgi:hypothetical protein